MKMSSEKTAAWRLCVCVAIIVVDVVVDGPRIKFKSG